MKAALTAVPPFHPVALVLETQAEVDALYAIFNHAWVTDAPAISSALWEDPFETLKTFCSPAQEGIHRELTAYIRDRAKAASQHLIRS